MARSAFVENLPRVPLRGQRWLKAKPGSTSAARGSSRPPTSLSAQDRLRLSRRRREGPYYVVERPDAAIIFPLTGEGEVVLVRQYRPR